jgi:hypothetical protein
MLGEVDGLHVERIALSGLLPFRYYVCKVYLAHMNIFSTDGETYFRNFVTMQVQKLINIRGLSFLLGKSQCIVAH